MFPSKLKHHNHSYKLCFFLRLKRSTFSLHLSSHFSFLLSFCLRSISDLSLQRSPYFVSALKCTRSSPFCASQLHFRVFLSFSWPVYPNFFFLPSTSAKIRAIEAKLQMMEQNPDDTSFSGPPAYIYNKPPEKKRWEPYSKSHHSHQGRPFRRFRRWPVLSPILESSLPPSLYSSASP